VLNRRAELLLERLGRGIGRAAAMRDLFLGRRSRCIDPRALPATTGCESWYSQSGTGLVYGVAERLGELVDDGRWQKKSWLAASGSISLRSDRSAMRSFSTFFWSMRIPYSSPSGRGGQPGT
jgi:hypothetical protein